MILHSIFRVAQSAECMLKFGRLFRLSKNYRSAMQLTYSNQKHKATMLFGITFEHIALWLVGGFGALFQFRPKS